MIMIREERSMHTTKPGHRHDRRSRWSLKIEQMGEDMEDLPDQEGRHIIGHMMRKERGKVNLRGTVAEYIRLDSPE